MTKYASSPILGAIAVKFYDIAEHLEVLFDRIDEFSRLKNIHHLGLIREAFESASHSKYEYLMLQCALSDMLDVMNKGIGEFCQGSIKINGENIRGNALLKCWFMLSAFGHSKNTIGDEKSLLHFAKRNKRFRGYLISRIDCQDLKEWSDRTIDNFNYVDFHHVLGMVKAKRKFGNQDKDRILMIYRCLLLDPLSIKECSWHKLARLRAIFDFIRSFSILAIDGHYSHVPISVNLLPIISAARRESGVLRLGALKRSIEPLRSYLYSSIYLDPSVLAIQRAYEVSVLDSVPRSMFYYADMDALVSLADKDGLAKPKSDDGLNHFVRITLRKEKTISAKDVYREYRVVGTAKRNLKGVEATVDHNPITNEKYVDIFTSTNINKKYYFDLILNCCRLANYYMAEYIEDSLRGALGLVHDLEASSRDRPEDDFVLGFIDKIEQYKERVDRDYGDDFREISFDLFSGIFWRVASLFAKNGIEISALRKIHDNHGFSYIFKSGEKTIDLFSEHIQEQIEKETDVDRAHELKATKIVAEMEKPRADFVFVYTMPLIVRDVNESPEKMEKTDIDGLIMSVSEKSVKVHFIEAKNTRLAYSKARSDIGKKLRPQLDCAIGRCTVAKIKNGKVEMGARLTMSISKVV